MNRPVDDQAIGVGIAQLRQRCKEELAAEARCPKARPASRSGSRKAVARMLGSICGLCAEIDRLHEAINRAERDHQNLVAAARATLVAASDSEPDPLYYLRDELRARGLLAGEPGDPRW